MSKPVKKVTSRQYDTKGNLVYEEYDDGTYKWYKPIKPIKKPLKGVKELTSDDEDISESDSEEIENEKEINLKFETTADFWDYYKKNTKIFEKTPTATLNKQYMIPGYKISKAGGKFSLIENNHIKDKTKTQKQETKDIPGIPDLTPEIYEESKQNLIEDIKSKQPSVKIDKSKKFDRREYEREVNKKKSYMYDPETGLLKSRFIPQSLDENKSETSSTNQPKVKFIDIADPKLVEYVKTISKNIKNPKEKIETERDEFKYEFDTKKDEEESKIDYFHTQIQNAFNGYMNILANAYNMEPKELYNNLKFDDSYKKYFKEKFKKHLFNAYNKDFDKNKLIEYDFNIDDDGNIKLTSFRRESDLTKKQRYKINEKKFPKGFLLEGGTVLNRTDSNSEFYERAKAGEKIDLSNLAKRNAYFSLSPQKRAELLALYEGYTIPNPKSVGKKYTNRIPQIDLSYRPDMSKREMGKLFYKMKRSGGKI